MAYHTNNPTIAGAPVSEGAVTNQLVLKGDKLVLTRPTQLSVCMTVDDHGDLLISDTELEDDAISSAFEAAPVLSNHEADILNFASSVCFHMDLQGTTTKPLGHSMPQQALRYPRPMRITPLW